MKKYLERSEQTGRSMVEMLGVLAIIGVLSVGGISGYSKAMAKFKMSKAMDQMSMLVANIRTAYGSMATYNGLATPTARAYELASRDMWGVTDDTLVNAFGGSVEVGAIANNGMDDTGFAIVYNGLGKEACIGLATADWGSAGLIGMSVSDAAVNAVPANGDGATYKIADMPVTLANAFASCSAAEATNSIIWFYY